MNPETEQIKERLDIAQIVGEYVQLKPAGRSLKGLCPFHNEKTPSFIVSPDRGTWHCFGSCGEGGDVFTFVQKIEGLDFPAALKMLAERAGVQLKARSPQTTNHRQRLFDVLSASARFYKEILVRQQAGKRALEYLAGRGMQEKTIEEFALGYAPDSWDLLHTWLMRQGFTEQEVIQSGAVGKSQRGKLYDRFRGRIIFPIYDLQGRVVAFGGRIVPWHETGDEGKYINSPEGPLYEKRRVVYNLHRAKHALRKTDACIVVEGYMDVIMLTQAGVENVVATSGTAFTEEHVQQLSRFTKTLHFAFDADAAGWNATISATQAALAAGLGVATIPIPAGKDPADVAVEDPAGAVHVMSQKRPLTLLLLEQLKTNSDMVDRQQQLEAVVSLIRLVKNPIQQGKMIQEVAATLHVSEAKIIDAIEASPASHIAARVPEVSRDVLEGGTYASRVEQQLIGLLLHSPLVRAEVFTELSAQLLLDPAVISLYNSMQRLAEENAQFLSLPSSELIDLLPEEQRSYADGVRHLGEELVETTSLTAVQEGQGLLRSLRRRSLRSRLDTLQARLFEVSDSEREEALKEFRLTTEELAQIDL